MQIVSVNIGREQALHRDDGRLYRSSINRHPVEDPVELGATGFAGDQVSDRKHHGGYSKAACCYPHEHYPHWSDRLDREMTVPSFGENLTTSGLLEHEVCIGDVFRIGSAQHGTSRSGGALVQVSQPRQPCWKLAQIHRQPEFPQWIDETRYTGFYLRVLEPGPVTRGDVVELINRPHPGLTIAWATETLLTKPPARERLERLLALPELSLAWREQVANKLAQC